MVKKYILIQIRPDGFYLNPDLRLPPDQTNIPWNHLGFRIHRDVYWLIELMDYAKETKVLRVKVEDYEPFDTASFSVQNPKQEILALQFEPLDWRALKQQLSHYTKSKLTDILINHDEAPDPWRKGVKPDPDSVTFSSLKPEDTVVKATEEPLENIIHESFWKAFSEVRISVGHVRFQQYIKSIDQVIEIGIENDFLIPEFDNIKFWFAKKLGTRRIFVKAQIRMEGDEVTQVLATSAQIDLIGPAIIDAVKYQRTSALTQSRGDMIPDKSLFTADEMFGLLDTDDAEGNVFGQSDADILAALLEKSSIRNKKQLAYLAGKKQDTSMPLRYTLYPHFGFLFYIEGETHHHFVWELLDSHATYMWSVEKKGQSADLLLRRIADTINTIRAAGRDPYKRAYREGKEDNDLVFHTIQHEGIESKFVDGFPKWRQRLEEQLV